MLSVDRWDARINRAQTLADRHPHAAEILRFYARLAEHQQRLSVEWKDAAWEPRLVIQALPAMLDWLERNGPAGIARIVPALRVTPASQWSLAIDRYLADEPTDAEDAPRSFVIQALLQPLAESCAMTGPGDRPAYDNRCPFCQRRPAVGVLRDAGQGTRRALVCGLCFTEWGFERIVCPSCGERKFDALPVYTAEQVLGARIDGCDSCGTYLKTIDASKGGTVVPVVDDLATITLDLWAWEHGYHRISPSFYL